jgi:hypothetical protein
VAYKVELVEAVRAYLVTVGLTRSGRIKLYAAIHDALALVPDSLRLNPAGSLGPGSPLFWFHHIFTDTGRLRTVSFVVDDSGAVYGVLRVVYADCP